jgi:hypothetical protein
MEGYSSSELDDAQDRWGLRFPADLVDLLRKRRPLLPGCFDWIHSPADEIQHALDWPFEGFLFDVQEGELWWPEWGAKPGSLFEQGAKLAQVFAAAPKLIPLAGHRYLPATPAERGNPVFSVYQSDVIHYGADLDHWLRRERSAGEEWRPGDLARIKEIPFWSEVVRRNC